MPLLPSPYNEGEDSPKARSLRQHAQAVLPDRQATRRTAHHLAEGPRPRTPLPGPYHPPAGRGLLVGHHRGPALLQLPHRRSLAPAVPGRGDRRAHRKAAWPPLSLRPGMGRHPRLLGDPEDPPRLRLPPPPLVLRPAGLVAPRAGRRGGQPGDGPPLAPAWQLGVSTTPAGPQAGRGGEAGQAGRTADTPGEPARGRDSSLAGRGRDPH